MLFTICLMCLYGVNTSSIEKTYSNKVLNKAISLKQNLEKLELFQLTNPSSPDAILTTFDTICANANYSGSGTFGSGASQVAITHNGSGSMVPPIAYSSPFTYTYVSATADGGNTVVITLTSNDPIPVVETVNLFVRPKPPGLGTGTQQQAPSCNSFQGGNCDGHLMVNGLDPNTDYYIRWSYDPVINLPTQAGGCGTWTDTVFTTSNASGTAYLGTNLCHGEYNCIEVYSVDGCWGYHAYGDYLFSQSYEIANAATGTNSSSCNTPNGSIAFSGISPANTTVNFTYTSGTTVVGPTSITVSSSGTYTLTGLSAGTYSQFVFAKTTDPTCADTLVQTVVITDPGNCLDEVCDDGIDNDGDGLIDCADPDCYLIANSGGTDSDNDGIDDNCDQDDDNDGILDVDECPTPTNSGLTGPLTTFTSHITTTNASSVTVPHVLDSITYNGTTYTDFVLPDSYESSFTLGCASCVVLQENGVTPYNYSSLTWDTDILVDAFDNRNLAAYQQLDGNNYSDGDYYDLKYNNPIYSSAGGFIAVTERAGNNEQVVQALDESGNLIGTAITIFTSNYVNLGVKVYTNFPSDVYMALYPIDDLVSVGTEIYGIRVSFGNNNTTDGPDGKVFLFGDNSLFACDYDNDGIPNHLDLDSDNDGCLDAIEGGGSFTNADLLNGRLTGGVGTNGIPTVAGVGQTLGESQNENISCLDAELCYIAADGEDDNVPDTLYSVNPITGAQLVIGSTGLFSVEAIAIDPVNSILYVTSGDTLGTLNPSTGAFTFINEIRKY